ncbi:Cna B-type domain-containing protein [Bacillus toyonensis]
MVDTKEVTAATEWKYTFEKLQAYDANGIAYKYEVKEQPIAGYEPKVNGYDITNTKVGQTKVEGTKTWKDDNAKDRPEMITVVSFTKWYSDCDARSKQSNRLEIRIQRFSSV